MASSGARLVHPARPSILDPSVPKHAAYATSTAATVTGPRPPGFTGLAERLVERLA